MESNGVISTSLSPSATWARSRTSMLICHYVKYWERIDLKCLPNNAEFHVCSAIYDSQRPRNCYFSKNATSSSSFRRLHRYKFSRCNSTRCYLIDIPRPRILISSVHTHASIARTPPHGPRARAYLVARQSLAARSY